MYWLLTEFFPEFWTSEKQKMKMEKENKYDTTRTLWNFDRTLMWKVRMVRSLADRTFQLSARPRRRSTRHGERLRCCTRTSPSISRAGCGECLLVPGKNIPGHTWRTCWSPFTALSTPNSTTNSAVPTKTQVTIASNSKRKRIHLEFINCQIWELNKKLWKLFLQTHPSIANPKLGTSSSRIYSRCNVEARPASPRDSDNLRAFGREVVQSERITIPHVFMYAHQT